MTVWTPAVLGVLHACVLYFCICTCSGQLSMFRMERCSRNMLIIIIIIIIIIIGILTFVLFLVIGHHSQLSGVLLCILESKPRILFVHSKMRFMPNFLGLIQDYLHFMGSVIVIK